MKSFVLCCVVMLLSAWAFAQNKFSLDVRAAAPFSNIWIAKLDDAQGNNIFEDVDNRFGLGAQLGVQANYQISERFSLVGEGAFSYRQSRIKTAGPTLLVVNGQPTLVNADFIYYRHQVFQTYLGLGYKVAPWLDIQLSPYFGVLLGQAQKVGDFTKWLSGDSFVSQENTDYGAALSLQTKFGRWTPYLRYEQGLNKQDSFKITDEMGQYMGTMGFRNVNLQLGIGFLLTNGKVNK